MKNNSINNKNKCRILLIIMSGIVLVVAICIYFCVNVTGKISLAWDGNLLWYNQPAAEFYSGAYDRTYYSYITDSNNVSVNYYDHNSCKLGTPFTLKSFEGTDDHSAPSLCIIGAGEDKGKIICMYSRHNSPLYCARSKMAEDISEFNDEVIIDDGDCTYPRPIIMDDGSIVVIYRKRIDMIDNRQRRTETLYFARSYDNGNTWTEPIRIINIETGRWVYAGPTSYKGSAIYIGYGLLNPDSEIIEDVRFFSFDVDKREAYANNEIVPLPIESDNTELIAQTQSNIDARVWDVKVASDGKPVITYMLTDKSNNSTTAFYALKTDLWNVTRIEKGKIDYYPSGVVIDYKDDKRVAISYNRDGIGEIEEWRLDDGNFILDNRITRNSKEDQYRPQYIKNYDNGLRIMWLSGKEYTKWTKWKTSIWAK